ncbi:MAG: glycoside hydrolase [Novosphingobium sp.]|nr:glycoside hydrolase [Novosphingobium sp.]
MIPTFIGLIQCLVGLIIVARGSLNAAFLFLILSSLFGGSAAIIMPALGNSSIPPVQFALLFLCLRIAMPRGGYAGAIPNAVRSNLPIILFALYGIAAAITAPRIFAGTMNVFPLRFTDARNLFDTVPLRPTSQNISSAVYLVGTMVAAIGAHIACRFRGGANTLVKGAVMVAWIHIVTGVIGSLTRGTAADAVFGLFRNASYAQLDQSYQGFVRINGVFPEASGYATFGLAWFIFNAECWYRGIEARATGRAALGLAAVLFFSTSSTAYIGLAIYAVWFAVRALLVSGRTHMPQLTQAALAAFAAVSLACLAMAVVPHLADSIWAMIRHMTVDKGESQSGKQRLFWAMQGWNAFLHSYGVGIGPGSFRSSSLVTGILGSMGIFGISAILVYLWRVLQPQRASTWGGSDDPGLAVGGAAACTVLLILVPAAISEPSADPGMIFALFSGAAIALRPRLAEQFVRPGQNPRGAPSPAE